MWGFSSKVGFHEHLVITGFSSNQPGFCQHLISYCFIVFLCQAIQHFCCKLTLECFVQNSTCDKSSALDSSSILHCRNDRDFRLYLPWVYGRRFAYPFSFSFFFCDGLDRADLGSTKSQYSSPAGWSGYVWKFGLDKEQK